MKKKPKVLLIDIETFPILASVWGLFDQNIGLNQIERDWSVASYAAKWKGDPKSKVYYQDNRKSKKIENDKTLLKGIWNLLNEADVVVGQNLDAFDVKKLNARFIKHGFKPPSPFKTIDTMKVAKKSFNFTSNKLAYLTDNLCVKFKKSQHKKFEGFNLWKECMKGNKEAWNEMKDYNIMDILSLEELWEKLQPWYTGNINFNVFSDDEMVKCLCGGEDFQKRGFNHSASGKFQRYQCCDCGHWTSSKKNLLTKEKKASLRK